jgi:hypothetical protein
MPPQPHWVANIGQWGPGPSQWNNGGPQGMTFPMSKPNSSPNSTWEFSENVQSLVPPIGSKGAHLPLVPPPPISKTCLPQEKTLHVVTNVELEPYKQLP